MKRQNVKIINLCPLEFLPSELLAPALRRYKNLLAPRHAPWIVLASLAHLLLKRLLGELMSASPLQDVTSTSYFCHLYAVSNARALDQFHVSLSLNFLYAVENITTSLSCFCPFLGARREDWTNDDRPAGSLKGQTQRVHGFWELRKEFKKI